MQSKSYQAFKHYEPSEAAAIIFSVVFGILLVVHLFQSIRAKIWYLWALIFATAMEFVGYILREYTINHRTQKPPSVIGQVLIIIAPAFFAAALYMIIERIILQIGVAYSPIRPSWITPIFVGTDVISIALQSIGATLLFNNEDSLDELKDARKILIAGLLVQLVAFSVFLFLTGWFEEEDITWKNGPGALIMIRSFYRAIEFITVDFSKLPPSGYFFNVEWAYYVLDALPIALATGVYNVIFPSKYLAEGKREPLPSYEQVPLSTSDVGKTKEENSV